MLLLLRAPWTLDLEELIENASPSLETQEELVVCLYYPNDMKIDTLQQIVHTIYHATRNLFRAVILPTPCIGGDGSIHRPIVAEGDKRIIGCGSLEKELPRINQMREKIGNPPLQLEILDVMDIKMEESLYSPIEWTSTAWRTFSRVAVGGTFDHLHAGHRLLLTFSALICEHGGYLMIGVTAADMLGKKKYAAWIQSYELRCSNVLEFTRRVRPDIHIEYKALHDPYGPAITDPTFTALVVSKETEKGGNSLNVIRKERGMQPLELVCTPVIGKSAEDKLSSTALREVEARKV